MITMTIVTIIMMIVITVTIVMIIMTIMTMIVTREQIRELGTRESEVQRIFAGLRQAVSSKVFWSDSFHYCHHFGRVFHQIGFIVIVLLSRCRPATPLTSTADRPRLTSWTIWKFRFWIIVVIIISFIWFRLAPQIFFKIASSSKSCTRLVFVVISSPLFGGWTADQ